MEGDNKQKYIKYFVGGVPADSKYKELIQLFKRYGDLKKITVLGSANGKLKVDHQNEGTSKRIGGYCFIKYKSISNEAINDPLHRIVFNGRMLEVAPLVRKSKMKSFIEDKYSKKIFVNNLPGTLTTHDLMSYFSQYDQVLRCFVVERSLKFTRESSDNRGTLGDRLYPLKNYGYVTFSNDSIVNSLVEQKNLYLPTGQWIQVYRYNPKNMKGEMARGSNPEQEFETIGEEPEKEEFTEGNMETEQSYNMRNHRNIIQDKLPTRRSYYSETSSAMKWLNHSQDNVRFIISPQFSNFVLRIA